MTSPTFAAYVAQRAGGRNWTLAPRTRRILELYGDDVICLSHRRYKAIKRDYRALYGDPHDPQRAELYQAAKDFLALCDGDISQSDCAVVTHRLRRALKAEASL